MASPDAPVAVVGAAGLLGRTVAEQLEARGVRPDRLRLSDTTSGAGRVQELAGEASVVAEVDADLLALADEVFLCVDRDEAEPLLAGKRARGSLWVDLSGAAAERPRVPLVSLKVNPQAMPGRPSGLVAAPGAEAQILSTVLGPLAAAGQARRVRAVVLTPASAEGDRGLDELYQQAVSLLKFGEPPREVFGAQLAFNLLPGMDAVALRAERETVRIVRTLRRRLTVLALRAPVFHGHAIALHVEAPAGADAGDLARTLAAADDVAVVSPPAEAGPAALAGRPEVVVAAPRADGSGKGFWIWAACDDLAAGAARNAVRIAAACREG